MLQNGSMKVKIGINWLNKGLIAGFCKHDDKL